MRVFGVGMDGEFTEYEQVSFEADHQESVLEDWLEVNHNGILEDSLVLIIGRQVPTDLGKSIDLLGVDLEGNVVVVELKRGRTPRDVVAQALEYAAFAARLAVDELEGILREYHDDESLGLADHHREYFNQAEAVAFNKDQRIVIIGQQVTPEIRQTALFLGSKGIQVTCVEFTFFRDADGGRLLSQEIVVGREHAKPPRATVVTKVGFLEACDGHGRAAFSRILDLTNRKGMLVDWRTKCFRLGVDVDGTRRAICYAYLPASKFGQSLWAALRHTGIPAEVVAQLHEEAADTGLFVPTGEGVWCRIDRAFTDAEVDALVAWCESVVQAIREHAVPGGLPPG